MGLTIHYNGTIAKPEFLPDLINEVRDIAEVYNWKYKIFEKQFPKKYFNKPAYNNQIYGICLVPPDCEPVPFCFLSNGRMSDLFHLEAWGKTESQEEQKYLYMLSTKTQYAGIKIHQTLILLFRHITKKYFSKFEMYDEGQYWEKNDFEVLQKNFKNFTDLINSFADAIDSEPIEKSENIELYFERLLNQMHKKRKKSE